MKTNKQKIKIKQRNEQNNNNDSKIHSWLRLSFFVVIVECLCVVFSSTFIKQGQALTVNGLWNLNTDFTPYFLGERRNKVVAVIQTFLVCISFPFLFFLFVFFPFLLCVLLFFSFVLFSIVFQVPFRLLTSNSKHYLHDLWHRHCRLLIPIT